MKNYTLYLIRHGITQGNLEGRYIGKTNLPLCKEGFEAIKKYKKQNKYPDDAQLVYSSPLERCIQTAEIIYPNRMLIKIPNLAECDFGEFEGKTSQELMGDPDYKEWLKGGYEAKAPGGETYGDFALRCIQGLEEILKDMMNRQVTKAALITHSGVIMNLLSGYGLPKGVPSDFATGQGEGFEIRMSAFLWHKGPTFEIVGPLF